MEDPIERLRALGEEHAQAATPDEARVVRALDQVLDRVSPEDLARYLEALSTTRAGGVEGFADDV